MRQKLVPEATSRQAKMLNAKSIHVSVQEIIPSVEVSSGLHCVRLGGGGVLFPSFPSLRYLFSIYLILPQKHFSEAANPLPCSQVL